MYRLILIILTLFTAVLSAKDQALDLADVRQVMQEIFEQHIDTHEMSGEMIKKSFQSYINQFDPERIYLTQSEITPFVALRPYELQKILKDYQRGDFSKFKKLNQIIQNAILRARQIRMSVAPLAYTSHVEAKGYARDRRELTRRIQTHLGIYLQQFRQNDPGAGNKEILAQYEEETRDVEDTYLFQTPAGTPFTERQKESYFALHLLKAFAASLDSHTKVLNPSEAHQMRLRLEKGFYGIGVVLKSTKDGIVISELVSGGVAAKSGKIEVNDKILEIDGKKVEDTSVDAVLDKLRGISDSSVSLVLERDGSRRFSVQLQRDSLSIDEDRVKVSTLPHGNGFIGIITLNSFYQGASGISSADDVKNSISNLKKKGRLKGLVLDLRENSGGYLMEAVKVAGLFITNGVVVISKYSNGQEKIYRDMDGKVFYSGPMVVLTSKVTASAAEIVAQALQDWGVAVVVGDEKTYGKGTIQSQTVTEGIGRSYFKVTVGKYYTVSGKTPQQSGVLADVIVPSRFLFEKIGEQYLQTEMNSDTIGEAYSDSLNDIDPSLRKWFTRYYVPTLQRKQTQWNPYVAPLRQASERRLARNTEYSLFIEKHQISPRIEQLQLEESVNVLKDMIDIRSQRYHPIAEDY